MPYQQIFEYFSPTRLIAGRGAIAKIPDAIREQGLRRGLVVTDPGLVAAGVAGRVLDVLRGADVPFAVYGRVEANPPFANVDEAYGVYVKERCDYLIGLGGGSSMDVAKCAGVAVAHGGGWRDLIGIGRCRNRIPFLLCVPTTYGTGSEVTPFAVVTDVETKFKASIGSPLILPHAGVLDPDLSVGLPLPIAGATGMDALTHAIESYVALTANPISEGLALHAIRLIGENLRQAAVSDHHDEATERMLIASTVAGMAFSQTRLGNVHAMSHPVGGHFGVPHGVANAIILTRVMAYNRMACPQKFAEVARALGEPTDGLTAMEAAELSIEAVERLGRDVGIPDGLAQAGVKEEAIPVLAEDAMKSGNVLINPRKTGLKDIVRLYEESMG
jgi:alcohol dehydrogenase class IV